MDLFRVILPVDDVDGAVRFYGALTGEDGERVSPSRHYFRCGATILACVDYTGEIHALDDRPNPEWFYFAVPDLETMLERVRSAGGTIEDGIAERPWGERSFYARDPFGNPNCLVDRETVYVGETRRST